MERIDIFTVVAILVMNLIYLFINVAQLNFIIPFFLFLAFEHDLSIYY